MIYYILPEWEVFSAYRGGALAHIAKSMMLFRSDSIVVCQSTDGTYDFPTSRVLQIPLLRWYARLKGRFFLPHWLTKPFFRSLFSPILSRLEKGDVVWCLSQPFVAAALNSTIHAKGARLIYHSESSFTIYPSPSVFRLFTADAFIFASEAMRQEALKLAPFLERTHAIHNGADEKLFYPVVNGDRPPNPLPVVLYVGRLHPEKGVHVLLAAMRILLERKVRVVCRIVGASFSGGSKPTSYAMRLEQDCPSNVEFRPFRMQTEIAEEYRSADIFCCPSVFQEPFGSVNIEAMACGIPVVASRVGGIPEIASCGGVILVEPNSAVELADALQGLLEDSALRENVGKAGLHSFKNRFTWPIIVKSYQNILESLSPNEGF